MPDGQNGVLDFWNWGVNDGIVVTPVAATIAPLPQFERPAYVLSNRKWGSTTFGTSGGTIRWAIIGAGQTYPSSEYTSAATPVDPVFNATIRAAFARWESVGNFDFVEVQSPAAADIYVIFDELSGRSSGTIGLASTYYIGSQIQESYISFDLGRRYQVLDGSVYTVGTSPASGTLSLYTLALHEIGHALGLGHEDDFDTIMNSYDAPSITDLTSDELAGIVAIYGSKGGAPTTPTTPTDDYAGSTATSGTLAVGGSVSGSIESASDSDWFRVTLTAGTTYRINLTGVTLADTWLVLRNSSGTQLTLDYNSGPGAHSQITYTPTSTGTFYVDAQGYLSTHTGTYTVALTQTTGTTPTPTTDDYAGSTSTTGAIAAGGSVTGNIETVGDNDWFRISLTAGNSYRFDLIGGTLWDPYLTLLNSSGTSLLTNDDSGALPLDSRLTYTASTTGVYYLSARSSPYALSGTGIGTYTITATQTGSTDDYAGSVATTGTLAAGGTTSGAIEVGSDSDWFRVTLTAGTTYRMNLTGVTLADTWLVLRNSSGTQLTLDYNSGPGAHSQITYTPTSTGTYYLDAQGYLSTHTGTYTLALAQVTDDYTATIATTGVIASATNGTAAGNIETNLDSDWFAITLQAGGTYTLTMTGTTLADPFLYLRNGLGTALASDNDSGPGLNAQITYTATSTGTYYVDARSNPQNSLGAYTITVTGTEPDDYAATTATTGVVTPGVPGAPVSGTIHAAGDTDWFRATLTAGTSYRFRLTNVSLTGAHLYVRNSAGTIVTSDIDGNGNPEIVYTPTTSGSYYLDARAASATAIGTYSVAVDNVSAEDLAASTATTGSIAAGATITSTIGVAGDVDWIRVTLTAGTLYQFDGRGSATFGGTLADPLLRLLNSSGAVVRSDNNSGADNDSRLLYTAASSGTYYIAMQSTSATATGTYTVGVTANPDDFTTTTATAGVATVGGTTSGTTEVAGDRDWFRAILTAGTSYAIEVRGGSPGSGLRWTQSSVVLRDGTGVQLATDTKSGLGAAARLVYTPTTTGAFYIDALAYSTGVGTYTVTVTSGAAQQAPATSEQSGAAQPAPAAIAETETGITAADLAALTAAPAIDLWDLPAATGQQAASQLTQPSPFTLLASYEINSPEDEHRLANTARFAPLFQMQQRTAFDLLPLG